MLQLIKKSMCCSYAMISAIGMILSIFGYNIRDLYPDQIWWVYVVCLLIFWIVLTSILFLLIYCYKEAMKHKPYETEINGKSVNIKVGDIFREIGLKVIPFNERYDTKVDDVIISHNSLNGIMIDRYVKILNELNETIKSDANKSLSPLKMMIKDEMKVYPLGRIIRYNDFLMVAFSHFDKQNRAYISFDEYEQVLFRMWSELRRVYAGKPIVLPLLGGGITTINEVTEKNYTELLKCILCTLRSSRFMPIKGISIVMPLDVMKKIDMNLIRKEF